MIDDLDEVAPGSLRASGTGFDVAEQAQQILDDVRARGDDAVRDATRRFDEVDIDELTVPEATIDAAVERVDDELLAALRRSRDRVAAVQEALVPDDPGRVAPGAGVTVDVAYEPVDRAGCYVPGGRAAYPSTVLMTAVPARVAGVGSVVVATPPGPDGDPPDATLAACRVADVDEVVRVGGVQAVAALAYGTETVDPVDVVVGPGNAYVDAAKGRLWGVVGVDLPAGPTELALLADGTADPDRVAAELIAQAEHDPDAWAVLVTPDADLAEAVADRVHDPVGTVRCLLSDDLAAGAAWIDELAPEHLQIVAEDAEDWTDVTAGTVFVGADASPVLGDYVTGADHVLPTGGAARWTGGLDATTFLAARTVQRVDDAPKLSEDAATLAAAEGLGAHAEAAEGIE